MKNNHEPLTPLGEAVRALVRDTGWSDSRFAREAEMNVATIRRTIKGQTVPEDATLYKIAKAAKRDADVLLRAKYEGVRISDLDAPARDPLVDRQERIEELLQEVLELLRQQNDGSSSPTDHA